MTDPIIDLTDYSFSEHSVVELADDGWFNTATRPRRRTLRSSSPHNQNERIIYARSPRVLNETPIEVRTSSPHNQNERIKARKPHILNEIPIEITDSPQINTRNSSVRQRFARISKNENQVEERDSSIESARERSPLGSSHGVLCPICLEPLGKQPLVSTRCGHVYCERCLTRALQREKKCPTCRKSLKGSTAFHPLYLNRE